MKTYKGWFLQATQAAYIYILGMIFSKLTFFEKFSSEKDLSEKVVPSLAYILSAFS